MRSTGWSAARDGRLLMLVVNARLKIPLREITFTFARSSGPGGQNVNKVSTKAQLRWSVRQSPSLPEAVRQRFLARFARRITTEGDLLLTSQRFRDAGRNVADCLEKLRAMLAEVAQTPRVRKPTRPTAGSVRRRLDQKRRQSRKKEGRRTRPGNDE
ncbi:MAG: aminoacyl-tRNA hydrolase [Pirellulales bacterium]|nr:aminoacyl-tRNA hydrolase [Pirellulales bacterium]